MGKMNFGRYMIFNVIGAVIWVPLLTYLGYFVGNLFPNARHFILPMVLVIIVISVLPGIIHYFKQRAAS
jgi:membrane-associated protein